MLLKRHPEVAASEITDEQSYVRRREFLRIAAGSMVTAAAAPLLACSAEPAGAEVRPEGTFAAPQSPLTGYKEKAVTTDEKLNTIEEITGYNNFYEFGTGKGDPEAVQRFTEGQSLDGQN